MIKRKTAYKMGVAALERQRREHILHANIAKMGVGNKATERAKKQVDRINQALAILQEDMKSVR